MLKIADQRMSGSDNDTMLTTPLSFTIHDVLIRKKGCVSRARIGCWAYGGTHNARASPHTRIVPGRLVCNHIRTHASSCTCIVSTGAPLHSGTAEWSWVCAALHAGGPCIEPLSHSLQSFGMRSEARGSTEAPRPQTRHP